MGKKRRMIFGVIGAEVNSIEQREIIKGIAEMSKEYDIDIAVISNIFNPNTYDSELYYENKIYDLILSEDFDALILLSESFVNEKLRETVKTFLMQKKIPIIIIGTRLPEFEISNCIFINTSDENDIEDITDHLIEKHGFKNIDFLSGFDFLEASKLRVQGYKNSLLKHGIPFDENKVYYGNFWTNSGESLAEKYINGELPYPEAIICANDHMAYGLMDKLMENNIMIPDKLTVIGYEYIRERYLHTPFLTTYQRNRIDLGKTAVRILYNKLIANIDYEFVPPKGKLICGSSCSCNYSTEQLRSELKSARIKNQYDEWNLFSHMDFHLTECSTLEAFIRYVGEFQFLVRRVQDICLCLYENWYDRRSDTNSDIITCRSVMPWNDQNPITLHKYNISELFSQNKTSAIYYFSPLFFRNRMFGHIMLRFDEPDTYDDIFRNWIKSISNGLEFLCRKNDIQYLLQCQNLSHNHDNMTNMLNENGIKDIFKSINTRSECTYVYAVMLKVCLNDSEYFSDEYRKQKAVSILDAAEIVKFYGSAQGICGRIDDNTFLCFESRKENIPAELISDKIRSAIVSSEKYMTNYGMDSFVCTALKIEDDYSYEDILEKCKVQLSLQRNQISERKLFPYYQKLLEIQNQIYINPLQNNSIEKFGKQYLLSTSYLRKIYKDCFGVSIHKDCILSKISLSRHLLISTELNISSIAAKSGYDDDKYFIRQFSSITQVTPNQYRTLMQNSGSLMTKI